MFWVNEKVYKLIIKYEGNWINNIQNGIGT